jgi:hypothetical protein
MWRSNFTIPHRFAAYIFVAYVLPPTFAANICRIHLPPTFAANICRIHLPHIFAANICRIHLPHIIAAYISEIRLRFEQASIFYAYANILSKRLYFDDFLQ